MAASSSIGEQQYSLRWNDFHSSILSSFRHLKDVEDFVDVTLSAANNTRFTAHKVVLSACSPYFRDVLRENPCRHPTIILKDVTASDVASLLRFMYYGEVNIGQEQLAGFLQTAQSLQVRGLADVNSGIVTARMPPQPSSSGNNCSAPATPRNTWQDNGRDLNDDDCSPPPDKRARSYSPQRDNNTEPKTDLQESLLGQALEGGPTIHTTPSNNIQAQSIGEDSNSMSDNEDISNNESILNSVKTEPSELMNDSSMEHHRSNFPASLLNLQGLMPGPSGIHASNQDPNYDHGLDEAEGAAYHHHHSHHQQHHRHRHHHHHHHHHHPTLSATPTPHDLQQQQQATAAGTTPTEDDSDQSGTNTLAVASTTTITTTAKFQRVQPYFRQQRMLREHHHQYGYHCPLCSTSFLEISTMRAHLEHHYPRDSPTCPVVSCAKTFSHPNSVRNHMRLKHPVEWEQIKTLRWSYV